MIKLIFSFALFLTISLYSQNFWQQSQGPYGGLISSMAVNPVNQSIFLGSYGSGIYRSTDNANTWQRTSNGFMDPIFDDGTITFAFNSSGYIFSTAYTKGIYVSTNNGSSWQQTGMTSGIFTALAVTPNGSVLAYYRSANSIKRSTDNGLTWNTVSSGLPVQVYINSFAVNSANGYVYAAGHSWGDTSVFRSSDNGASWQPMAISGANASSIALNSSGHVFIGGQYGAYRSTNNGISWQQINNGLPGGRINNIHCSSNGNVFASTDSALFRSTNNGSSWAYLSFSGKVTHVFASLTNGSLLCGVGTEGLFRSVNNGSNWNIASAGLNSMEISGCMFGQNGIAIVTTDEGVHRSSDNGITWAKLSSGLRGKNFTALVYSASSNFLCSGDSGIFRSDNSGTNWTKIPGPSLSMIVHSPSNNYLYGSGRGFIGGIWRSVNNGLSWELINYDFSAALIAVNSSGHIFAGTSGGGVYKSTNNGVNWVQQSLNSGSVRSIGVAPNGYIYASLDGSFPNPSGMFRSTNGGVNWQHMGFNYATYSIVFNSAGHIFIGSFGSGIFRSTNQGASWDTVNTGLINKIVISLSLNPQGFLYAGTYYGGLFKSSVSTIGISNISTEIPNNYKLSQNYPNPFNPVTKINFSITKGSLVTLKVYDILGKEVKLLINEVITAGVYEVDFNASALPSGVYFYKITAGDFTDTKKMMLIK